MNLKQFINPGQLQAIRELVNPDITEEYQYFIDKVKHLKKTIQAMPRTYETSGQKDPIVYLHYFYGGSDWYITERDILKNQKQAFGAADLSYGPELGYINIQELINLNVELDLYWEPKPLSQI